MGAATTSTPWTCWWSSRDRFTSWIVATWTSSACTHSIKPAPTLSSVQRKICTSYAMFPNRRSRHRSLQRSHRTTWRVLLAQGFPRQIALGPFLRQRTGSSVLFPNQSSPAPGANYLPTLQDALAGRIILQMDQAASANQALLRKLDERSQDSGLDRGVRLRAGGDLEKGASTTAKFTQHFTNFKREHV